MNYFKQAREQIGASQSEMAKALGVHSQNISNWERGKAQMPPKFLNKMRKYLTSKEYQSFLENYKQTLIGDFMKRLNKRMNKYVS